MNKSRKYGGLIIIALLFSSCSDSFDEPSVIGSGKELRVSATINTSSRASGSQWDYGDMIGVSGGGYHNVPYQVAATGTMFEPIGTAISLSGNDTEFTAYYPYNGQSGETVDFSIVDETGTYASRPENVDFMFARATASAENSAVEFSFSHCMTQLVIDLNDICGIIKNKEGQYYLKLEGVATTGTFDATTGIVTPDNINGTIKLPIKNDDTAIAVILPPATKNNGNLITISIISENDGVTTGFQAEINCELAAGVRYTYHLTPKS